MENQPLKRRICRKATLKRQYLEMILNYVINGILRGYLEHNTRKKKVKSLSSLPAGCDTYEEVNKHKNKRLLSSSILFDDGPETLWWPSSKKYAISSLIVLYYIVQLLISFLMDRDKTATSGDWLIYINMKKNRVQLPFIFHSRTCARTSSSKKKPLRLTGIPVVTDSFNTTVTHILC